AAEKVWESEEIEAAERRAAVAAARPFFWAWQRVAAAALRKTERRRWLDAGHLFSMRRHGLRRWRGRVELAARESQSLALAACHDGSRLRVSGVSRWRAHAKAVQLAASANAVEERCRRTSLRTALAAFHAALAARTGAADDLFRRGLLSKCVTGWARAASESAAAAAAMHRQQLTRLALVAVLRRWRHHVAVAAAVRAAPEGRTRRVARRCLCAWRAEAEKAAVSVVNRAAAAAAALRRRRLRNALELWSHRSQGGRLSGPGGSRHGGPGLQQWRHRWLLRTCLAQWGPAAETSAIARVAAVHAAAWRLAMARRAALKRWATRAAELWGQRLSGAGGVMLRRRLLLLRGWRVWVERAAAGRWARDSDVVAVAAVRRRMAGHAFSILAARAASTVAVTMAVRAATT
ncbi:unnamed protein product, partial [Phaeothamnion confervicola]